MNDQRDETAIGIEGCRIARFLPHRDERGSLTELFRHEWDLGFAPVQWNFVTSEPDVLRGVHVHARHLDYICLLDGRMLLYLHDIRPASPTANQWRQLTLAGERSGILIPPGVAHGFFFPQRAALLYAMTTHWDASDELGCHWASPGLHFELPTSKPKLSQRDHHAPTLEILTAQLMRAMNGSSDGRRTSDA